MELLRINYESERPTVSARELHEGLEIKSNFTTWFDRMCEYGFLENIDYWFSKKRIPIIQRIQQQLATIIKSPSTWRSRSA